MQYQVYDNVLIEYTDGVNTFRDGSRGGAFVTDVELSATGFSGAETTDEGVTGDWMNISDYNGSTDANPSPDPSPLGVYRDGITGGVFVTDMTLTATGFDGDESLDDGLTGDWFHIKELDIV